jgi:5'-3' exonuclease
MAIYKQQLPALGDYLTLAGKISFDRVDIILHDIAKIEEILIKQKKDYEDRQKSFAERTGGGSDNRRLPLQRTGSQRAEPSAEERKSSGGDAAGGEQSPDTVESKEAKALLELQAAQAGQADEDQLNKLAAERMKDIVKRLLDEKGKSQVEKYVDHVKMGEDGWKIRYYKEKFHVDQEDMKEFLANIRQVYLEGL